MIAQCRVYLEQRLKAAMGEKTKVFHTYKELSNCMESHVASVLIDSETLTRSGHHGKLSCNTALEMKLFNREQSFSVSMGEYTLEALEPMYEAFLASLDRLIPIGDGYSATLDITGAEWLLKEDNVLKSNVSVVMTIVCSGGIWKPIATTTISNVQIKVEE